MDYQEQIKNLLNNYIERNNELKRKYEENITFIALYEELIPYLNGNYQEMEDNRICISILLNTIYNNNIYSEFYSNLLKAEQDTENTEDFTKFIARIFNDYHAIKEETKKMELMIARNKNTVSSARKIILSFKYQTPFPDSSYDIANAKRILSYYEIEGLISNKEELLFINEIELYNRRITTKNSNEEEKEYTKALYEEIPNILNAGFQKHDNIEVSSNRKSTLDDFVSEIYSFMSALTNEQLIEDVEKYRNYNLEDDEYNYIVTKLLDKCLEELITFYQLLTDKEVYSIRRDRQEIIKNYYGILDKYLCLNNYYDKINELVIEEDEEESNDKEEVRKLIYSCSKINPTKAKILADMDDVPYEYYSTVSDLINDFKNGQISSKGFKALINNKNCNGYKELKNDQVRIVLKHIKDNIYCVMGVFVKKSDNDISMYNRMCKRNIPNTDTERDLELQLELSEYIETELDRIITEKGRKGTR